MILYFNDYKLIYIITMMGKINNIRIELPPCRLGDVYKRQILQCNNWLLALGDTMKKDINTLFMLAGKRKICNFFIGEDGSK